MKFSGSGANPFAKQTTLYICNFVVINGVCTPALPLYGVIYPYSGGTVISSGGGYYQLPRELSIDGDYVIIGDLYKLMVMLKKPKKDEPPWALLAKELAPHLIYEDGNQEFPTSIFFDEDRDMSNNGVPATYPGGGQRIYAVDAGTEDKLRNYDTDFEDDYVHLTTWIKSHYISSSSDYLRVSPANRPSGAWKVEYRSAGSFVTQSTISVGPGTLSECTLIGNYQVSDLGNVNVYGYSEIDQQILQEYGTTVYNLHVFYEDAPSEKIISFNGGVRSEWYLDPSIWDWVETPSSTTGLFYVVPPDWKTDIWRLVYYPTEGGEPQIYDVQRSNTYLLIGSFNIKGSQWPVEVYGYVGSNRYLYLVHEDISIQQYKGKGYYAKTLTEKQNLETTYMQAYEGDVDIGSGVTHKMLGIQYWFYYPYHDDPVNPNGVNPHQHDWWYVWVVYDETNHGPYQVIYDFHHNVRVLDWYDARVHIDYTDYPFHPQVWVDAGGHHGGLYTKGADVETTDAVQLWIDRDNPTGRLKSDPSPEDDDEIFGVMIDLGRLLRLRNLSVNTLAYWRESMGGGNFVEGTSLNVEDFKTVYVYSVGAMDTNTNEYPIGYTGDNYPSVAAEDSMLGAKYNYWPRNSGGFTYLPWASATDNSVYQAWMWSSGVTRGWAWNEESSSP